MAAPALAAFVRSKLTPRQCRVVDDLAEQCPVPHCRACGPAAVLAPCLLNEGEIIFLCDTPQVRRVHKYYFLNYCHYIRELMGGSACFRWTSPTCTASCSCGTPPHSADCAALTL